MKSRFLVGLAVVAMAFGADAHVAAGTNATGFVLARAGDQFIPPKAKDRIIEIHSEQSVGSLSPNVWYVDYFDPTATFKKTEVKFIAGKMAEVKHPKSFVETFTGTKQLSWRKLKIDSDRALAIALKDPDLKKLDLQADQFWLERTVIGASWKIRFWITRLGDPGKLSEVGDLYISTTTGEVLKNALHF